MNEKIAFYHAYACRPDNVLLDAVAADLDLEDFFRKTDYTTSYIGKR